MTEPRFANYVQLHLTDPNFKWEICKVLSKAEISYHFSKNNPQGNDYFMYNVKHKKGVWKSIKTETKVKTIDIDFMKQLEFLGKVSNEAQVEYLLAPM